MLSITSIPIYQDNYVWVLSRAQQAWVIDPGDHQPVIEHLHRHRLSLEGILITHHHWDHITGVAPLLEALGRRDIPVWGPPHPNYQLVTQPVSDGQQISVLDAQLQVLATPGHTRDHVVYYLASQAALFCGDTLFNCGCGRIFDSSARELLDSLNKLKDFDDDTQVFCTHEYTLSNLHFAQEFFGGQAPFEAYQREMHKKRAQGLPTVPFRLAEQRCFNPFLMSDKSDIRRIIVAAQDSDDYTSEREYFAALRAWKDRYR